MPTNFIKNCDGFIYCYANWVYNATDGMFFAIALASFCVILMFATGFLGWKRAFGFGSFIGMLGAVYFLILNLLSWYLASGFIIVGIIGIVMMVISESD